MKHFLRALVASASILLLAVASDQCITRGYIYSEIGTLFTWSGSAPSWSGSMQDASYTDFTTYVQNNGSCGGSSLQLITYGAATSCAVNYAMQTINISASTNVSATNFSPTIISAAYPVTLTVGSTNCTSTATTTAQFTITIKNTVPSTVLTGSGSSTNGAAYSTSGFGSVTSGAAGTWTYANVYTHTGGGCTGSATLTYY